MTNTVTEIDESQIVDMPCGYSEHSRTGAGGRAVWLVQYRTPKSCGCQGPGLVYFCEGCMRRRLLPNTATCQDCSTRSPAMENLVTIARIRV